MPVPTMTSTDWYWSIVAICWAAFGIVAVIGISACNLWDVYLRYVAKMERIRRGDDDKNHHQQDVDLP